MDYLHKNIHSLGAGCARMPLGCGGCRDLHCGCLPAGAGLVRALLLCLALGRSACTSPYGHAGKVQSFFMQHVAQLLAVFVQGTAFCSVVGQEGDMGFVALIAAQGDFDLYGMAVGSYGQFGAAAAGM